ncbi:Caspase domain [Babesia microti strain RI]|uniref:Caspase domain n=1 Tax=Babesia microti (strain RI) TaxID=1133968 RepID=I7I8V2_BABMR|nr:Caspase domain [Babesia microti strain RI]CCF73733.1 Caspase domain [Babesia microti strain RI]|eukprot:XP_012648342.1 Caspase domain [Babesia microti strain RI]
MQPNTPSQVNRNNCTQSPLEKHFYPRSQGISDPSCAQVSTCCISNNGKAKGLIIGCNYVDTQAVKLSGACNDAAAFAITLVDSFHFNPRDLFVLTDEPSIYDTKRNGYTISIQKPTKRSILLGLQWLVKGSKPDDLLILYFSGHTMLCDDMSGWEDEGYDEALVPCDFVSTRFGGSCNVIPTKHIKEILVSADPDSKLVVFLDTSGGQTILDPSSVPHPVYTFIKGCKLQGIWPICTATDKVNLPKYDLKIWKAPEMEKGKCRPKFLPATQVDNVEELRDPVLQAATGGCFSVNKCYCLAGARWSQVALEALLPPLEKAEEQFKNAPKVANIGVLHGVFTHCLICVLKVLKDFTFKELEAAVVDRIGKMKKTYLPQLDQVPQVTLQKGSVSDKFITHPYNIHNKLVGTECQQGWLKYELVETLLS